jgi:hypothetical protein
MRKGSWLVGIVLIGMWSVALFATGDTPPAGSAAAGFKPAASLDALMDGQNEAFMEIGRLLDDSQAKNRMNTIYLRAELIAELANVNTYHKGAADYRAWAGTVRDTALELGKEAKKKKDADEGKMKELYKKLDTTCQACHDKYK